MVDPVPCSIQGDGKVAYGIPVDVVVKLEEDTQASMSKDGMCRFGENVIV
jgi:hypothetical protein